MLVLVFEMIKKRKEIVRLESFLQQHNYNASFLCMKNHVSSLYLRIKKSFPNEYHRSIQI